MYAHTLKDRPEADWELLSDHLNAIARDAADFASYFEASDFGRLAGLWHDLGKYADAFQSYLRESTASPERERRGPDHSSAGAQLAAKCFPGEIGRLLAYGIAGHHTGLADWIDDGGGTSGLRDRLAKDIPEIADALQRATGALTCQPRPALPPLISGLKDTPRKELGLRLALFGRMLFSCLVDADFLSTERFMSPDRSAGRSRPDLSIATLTAALNAHLAQFSDASGPVNQVRASLQADCIRRAGDAPGLFSLTAPTGAGKTLSSLTFALRHAETHGLCRIIYALPFTSVTEQTAATFRDVFAPLGTTVVLEHHSSAEDRGGEDETQTPWSRLAAENWDAPVIVTTNVQLLESLFASRPSKCRKLHNIARSVIVLDEAQALPVQLLHPTLAVLDELARGYGCSIVLSSATQPALNRRTDFEIGLTHVREIVSDPDEMARSMRRVRLRRLRDLSDEDLAERLLREERVLTIVNTKGHAASLFRRIRDDTLATFHLSAAMCAAHRSEVLHRIREVLAGPGPCRLISTQVIEAGVDIDFPVVYRAMAGLDSIVQAGGRCNREGHLPIGELITFDTTQSTKQIERQAKDAAEIFELFDDALSLEAIERYFQLHLWHRQSEWDKYNIHSCFPALRCEFAYRKAADLYRVIEDSTHAVVVPYGDDGAKLCDTLRFVDKLAREHLRAAQRYIVGVRDRQLAALFSSGACELVHDSIAVLREPKLYDVHLGLLPAFGTPDPEGYCI
ncbi:MAG: CRISPR-associated helicase Cas3' [Phycisphaerales bacterium]|nr:CRISPR-associated helicase Cas3' [Phycisphaerales bacterium]